MGVAHTLIQLQRRFLWGGNEDNRKIALLSWDKLQRPLNMGGLNLGNLHHKNRGLLFKWVWRFFDDNEERSLWKQVIRAKYNYHPNFTITNLNTPTASGPWKNICAHLLSTEVSKKLISTGCRKQVGNGRKTLFWHDLWLGDKQLKELFPRLFRISTNQLATVSSMGFWNGFEWQWEMDWLRVLRPRDISELHSLFDLLKQVALSQDASDALIWLPNKSGKFSVKSFSFELANCSNDSPCLILKGLWRNLVPYRIEIFVWFAILEKLNTRSKLANLNIIQTHEDTCVLCSSHQESCSMLFLHCKFSREIWNWWLGVWNVQWTFPLTLREAFIQWTPPFNGTFFSKVWHASLYVILWTIWKERNDRIFSNKSASLCQLQVLVLVRLCWWISGWNEAFPYSISQVLQNPNLLNWKLPLIRSMATLLPSECFIWSAPKPLSLKWNIDASLNQATSSCAIGGVLRNSDGKFICLFSSPVPLMDINSAEVFAIHRAIRISSLSENLKDKHIVFESDSKNVVDWCNSISGGPWNLNFILNFIRNNLARRNFSLIYKGRESNGIADALAKQGTHRNSDFIAWM